MNYDSGCLPSRTDVRRQSFLSTASDKIILISGDSHMIPFIPIISCYYKKTIVLDSRYSGDDTSYYWENENIDDVIICPSFNADISKYINKNFIS